MKVICKITFSLCMLLMSAYGAFAQSTDVEGIYVSTSIENGFNYETLSGNMVIESFVKDSIPNPIPPTPLDLVFVIDVSGSMGFDLTLYENQESRGYSYNDISNGAYYVLYDGSYYKVEANSNNSQYYLRFDIDPGDNRTWRYLNGDDVVNSRPSSGAANKTTTIWTGELYKVKETTDRLTVVQQATKDFVDVIAASSSSEVDNKIALVKFSADNTSSTKIVRNLTSVLTGASTLKKDIDNLAANGGTYPNTGLKKVLDIFTGAGTDDRQRVVILFTDGTPSGDGSGAKVASEAINNSKTLKDRGATVYTVGILDATNLTSITEDMMNYVSSKYPDAEAKYNSSTQKMTTTPGDPVEGDFFFNSPDGSAIPSIFNQIAEMVAPSLLILDTESTVKNFFTSAVKLNLPSGVSSIDVYTEDCIGFNKADTTYTFDGNPQILTSLSIDLGTDGQSLVTSGFDYSENWCGLEADGTTPHGKKLILKMPFSFTPTVSYLTDDEFKLDLSDENAGMFKGDDKVSSAKQLSSSVPFASLIIHKDGLHKGESAVFTIEREPMGSETANTVVNRIVLTGTSEEGTRVSFTQHFLNPNATYVVKEHTDWSWTYKTSETAAGSGYIQKKQDMTEVTSGTTASMIFEYSKQEKLPKYSESLLILK